MSSFFREKRVFLHFIAAAFVALASASGCRYNQPPELTFPGPLLAVRWDVSFGEDWPLTVFYPDTPGEGPYPLVVFNPGWNQTRASYVGYGEQLAQWGFVCVIRAFPNFDVGPFGIGTMEEHVRQVQMVIDWCAAESDNPESPLHSLVDAENVGITGHSHGGLVAFAAAFEEPRIKAIVSLDTNYEPIRGSGLNGMEELEAPTLWLVSDDGVQCLHIFGPPGVKLYDRANPPAAEVTIHGSSHIAFIERSQAFNILGQVVCGGGKTPQHKVRSVAYRYMIPWFLVYLRGEESFAEYYRGAHAKDDVDQGIVSIRARYPE